MKRCLFNMCLLVLAVFLTASCVKEISGRYGSRPKIVPMVRSVETKSAPESPDIPGKLISERIVSSADGFDLIEMVYENDSPVPGSYGTKGTVVTRDNLDKFKIDAYAEDEWHDNTLASGVQGSSGMPNSAGLYFTAECSGSNSAGWSLTKTAGRAREGAGGELYWINDVPMTFWSYNVVAPTWNPSSSKATFSYTVKSDVSKQEDLVFAYSRERRTYNDSGADYGKLKSKESTSGADDDEINIWFYHAFSTLQFRENEDISNYRISKIELQNIYSQTACEMTVTGDTPSTTKRNIAFGHTPSVKASFAQEYSEDDSSLDPPESTTGSLFKPGDGKTFIMIPQTLPDDAKLKVTFTYTGTPSATTSPVFDFDGTWEAGKYYVYKIDLTGNIHVKILESCSSTAKSDVKFQNTSNVNEYIRAAVVANWYDDSGNIVAAWDKTRDGDITPGTGWTTGSDGFYYYTQPVATQATTANLFDSFTKPTAAPVTGAHFEMTVMAQAVASDGHSSYSSAF